MFHFKKFSIDDSKVAMKIGTDSVLLGAWLPCENETRILDIGTGSGILALMMAQRNYKTPVDAVEIDQAAAAAAVENVHLCPWTDQITIFNSPIQEYSTRTTLKYSLIISNPPFFTDSLKAPDAARSMARHNDSLPVKDLLSITSKLLTKKGKSAFIIPADAFENWTTEASNFFLYPALVTKVKSSASYSPHRVMVVFARNEKLEITENELCIYSAEKIYSEEYRGLTKEFYLNF